MKKEISKPKANKQDFNTIVEIKGKQYPIKEGQTIKVDRIDQEENTDFNDIKVLFYKNENQEVFFGKPFLENIKVQATVKEEKKDKKVKVVHYKPKSGIRKTQGHRQRYSILKINTITAS